MNVGRTRRWALAALAVAVAAQVVWLVLVLRRGEASAAFLTRPALFTGIMGWLWLTRGRNRFVVLLGRLAVGGAFLNALWHRFDDFSGFVAYTAEVNAFLPAPLIPTVAVVATVLECVLSAAMLLGIAVEWAALASAALLFLFATAMTVSGLDPFEWAVYVLSAGAWVVATSSPLWLTVDELRASWHAARAARR